MLPPSFATTPAAPTSWEVVGVRETQVPAQAPFAVLSASGDLYSLGSYCAATTLKVGDTTGGQLCLTRTTGGYQVAFAVAIGGVDPYYVTALALDQAGNVFVGGGTFVPGFATTPGAYRSTAPTANPAPWLCKLSGVDGHPIYCTYLDFGMDGSAAFAVDSGGSVYFSGPCGTAPLQVCVEKLGPAGDAAAYDSPTGLSHGASWTADTHLSIDAFGHVGVVDWQGRIAILDAGGKGTAEAAPRDDALPVAIGFDPAGNPQIVVSTVDGRNLVRRYKGNLSGLVFETPLPMLYFTGMSIDSAGITNIWGASQPGFVPVHATQACDRNSDLALSRVGSGGEVLQATFLDALPEPPASFVGRSLTLSPSGALLLIAGQTWKILELGPANFEIGLSCVVSAASLLTLPLGPNALVDLTGSGIGPEEAVTAAPDASGQFPFQLGGAQVTFDGVPAPLLYAGSSQVKVVTPGALADKTTTNICVILNSGMSCMDAPVQAAAPDIFAKILSSIAPNPDGTVTVFLTGMGTTTPAPRDGMVTRFPLPAQDLKVEGILNCQASISS